ncbi:MAG: hypothetical protein KF773_42925 [Deltaproteobacteria bacterium]|nr:hypothetical protein [Deltaproteobacteria bacterium]MCW5804657.1 hypothetical protein [Deltaproteobacteria bacterium]
MGRLDDIAERNRRGYKPPAKQPARADDAPRPILDPERAPGKRLENIVARNRHRGWPRERTIVMLMLGLALLLILSLMLFTDLGVRDSTPLRPILEAPRNRVHDIQLRRAPTPRPPARPTK